MQSLKYLAFTVNDLISTPECFFLSMVDCLSMGGEFVKTKSVLGPFPYLLKLVKFEGKYRSVHLP